MTIELKEGVYWVGAVDWTVRDFHGYITPNGTTYNNYLILDEQPTLVDTVKHEFVEVSLASISRLIDPAKIANVVINHIEPDHASGIETVMCAMPNATIHVTEKGRAGLERYCNTKDWKFRIVKTGDTLQAGKKTLLFMETPMLHWPDSMMTYVKEDKLLISQDAFGQHYASASRFDDEFVSCQSASALDDAVIEYYANILMPFGTLIKNKVADIRELGIEIDMIAPDHGVI